MRIERMIWRGGGSGAWAVFASLAIAAALLPLHSVRLAHAEGPASGQKHAEQDALTDQADAARPPASAAEARDRARLLHETIHGSLQVVHRDFFSEERSHTIPSRSLEDVFSELKKSHGVTLRWLAVNATAMSVDNEPADEFESAAVKAIASGATHHEAVEAGNYRYAGRIRLEPIRKLSRNALASGLNAVEHCFSPAASAVGSHR